MTPLETDPSAASPSTTHTARRPFLRALATGGVMGAFGLPGLTGTVGAAVPGVTIEYKRCKVAFVSNASALDAIAVYYADRNGDRNARYDIAPTVTNPRGFAPLVVEYDPDEDRTQIQLAEPRGALVCVIAEAGSDRTIRPNPTDACVPAGFNTTPTAAFTVSDDPTVGEPVTFTSTATDPDDPERLYYAWDLDGDGTYETAGQRVTVTYINAGDRTVGHRVTDDCGASDTTTRTITVTAPESGQVTKLVPAGLTTRDWFGFSMALEGDTLAVGARRAGSFAGAVYVYDRTNLAAPPQKLVPTGLNANDGFGYSVAVAGDNLAVGAVGDDDAGQDSGTVYVYDLADLAAPPKKLLPAGVGARDRFGWSVAAAGDSLAVGAIRDGDAGVFAGAVYVYDLANLAASPQRLVPSGLDNADFFGWSVAAAGDTLAVGASRDDDAGGDAGAVYVYDRTNLAAPPQKLVPDGVGAEDLFGESVAVAGDTLVVGASKDDDAGQDAGAVYVYDLADLAAPAQKLVPKGLDTTDNFGSSVVVGGDTIAAGAYLDDDAGPNTGAVYVFQ